MLRKLLSIVNMKMLHMIYFVHFYSPISYGIIFWGSSSSLRNVFITQKRAIRIMLRLGPRSSLSRGFQKVGYTYSSLLIYNALMLFAVTNLNMYQTNTSVHGMNTRQQNKLHIPSARLSSVQRGVYYSATTKYIQIL